VEESLRYSLLFDHYGPLLTDQQQQAVRLYYGEDLSLGEIAELWGTSRQAVHDTLRRATQALETYEEKLGLLSAAERNRKNLVQAVDELDEIIRGLNSAAAGDGRKSALERVRRTLADILNDA